MITSIVVHSLMDDPVSGFPLCQNLFFNNLAALTLTYFNLSLSCSMGSVSVGVHHIFHKVNPFHPVHPQSVQGANAFVTPGPSSYRSFMFLPKTTSSALSACCLASWMYHRRSSVSSPSFSAWYWCLCPFFLQYFILDPLPSVTLCSESSFDISFQKPRDGWCYCISNLLQQKF